MYKKFLLFTVIVSSLQSSPVFIEDANNFYSKKNALFLAKVFIPCAIMANTSIDKDISDYYRENIRSNATDTACIGIKQFGSNMSLTITLISGMTVGYILQGSKTGEKIYDFSINSFRGIITGLPALIALQNLVGADRPKQHTNSYWSPFTNDHGVAGHTYMAAVPFLTAANMTENPYLKAFFYVGSTIVGFSRLNDDKHYLSQNILGWSLAYAACNAVSDTNLYVQAGKDKLTVGYTF